MAPGVWQKQCDLLSEHLLSRQADSKDMLPLIGRQVLTSEIQKMCILESMEDSKAVSCALPWRIGTNDPSTISPRTYCSVMGRDVLIWHKTLQIRADLDLGQPGFLRKGSLPIEQLKGNFLCED